MEIIYGIINLLLKQSNKFACAYQGVCVSGTCVYQWVRNLIFRKTLSTSKMNDPVFLGSNPNQLWLDTHKIAINSKYEMNFDLGNTISCKKRGFVSLCYNHIRNITVILLKEICKDIPAEKLLQ